MYWANAWNKPANNETPKTMIIMLAVRYGFQYQSILFLFWKIRIDRQLYYGNGIIIFWRLTTHIDYIKAGSVVESISLTSLSVIAVLSEEKIKSLLKCSPWKLWVVKGLHPPKVQFLTVIIFSPIEVRLLGSGAVCICGSPERSPTTGAIPCSTTGECRCWITTGWSRGWQGFEGI